MKKILAIMLAAMMLLTLVACDTDPKETTNETPNENNTPVELPYKNVEELVGMIVSKIPEESQAPAAGAVIEIGAEGSDYTMTDLGLPAEFHGKVDGAYQHRHMMNANTFSMGVFHFTSSADIDAGVEAIKNTLATKEWFCGIPEKFAIVTLPGDYVIVLYGLGGLDPDPNFALDLITPVIDAAKTVVDGVKVVVDQPVA